VHLPHLVYELDAALQDKIKSIRNEDFIDNLTIISNTSKRSDKSSCTSRSNSRRTKKRNDSKKSFKTSSKSSKASKCQPTVILPRPTSNSIARTPIPYVMTSTVSRVRPAKVKSFQEHLDRMFPAYVYPAVSALGEPTVEDTCHLTIEDQTLLIG